GTVLHPLLHRNTSDVAGLRFSTYLSGDEFFLSDHVVQGAGVLPGVAQLEMARRAASEVLGEAGRIALNDVAWVRPMVVGADGLTVHIALYPEETGEIGFEIYSEGDDGEALVYSQGVALVDREETLGASATYDLAALREQCAQARWDAPACYAQFEKMGLHYGPGFQGLSELFVGHEQVLARITLPASVEMDGYVLHPSLLDAALQATLGLQMGAAAQAGGMTLMMPFALGALETRAPCTIAMWAIVRYSAGSQAGDAVLRLDIDLCDEQGVVCVRFTQFSTRALHDKSVRLEARESAASETELLLTPVWDVVNSPKPVRQSVSTERVLILGGTPAQREAIFAQFPESAVLVLPQVAQIADIEERLRTHGEIDHLVWIVGVGEIEAQTHDDEALILAQQQGIVLGFRLVKALLALGFNQRSLNWTVLTCQTQAVHGQDAVAPAHAGVHGFVGSMAKEFRRWQIRLLDLPSAEPWPIEHIFHLPYDAQGDALAWRSGQWFRQTLLPVEIKSVDQRAPLYRQGGVYVVIGGAGGIGQAWSEYMVREYQANIVWIGRRVSDETIEHAQARLAAFGPMPLYIAADATDRLALERAREQVLACFPAIHGVMHAAIALLDKSLVQMDEARLRAGLAAKVDVSVRMCQVFGGLSLDFMLFCSSLLSFIKAPGQSNYAAGCTFKDAYALQLVKRLPYPVKIMNWGYWGSVGVVASQVYRERMAQQGFGSIEVHEGIRAIETLLAVPIPQLGFLKVIKAGAKGGIFDLIGDAHVSTDVARFGSTAAALAAQSVSTIFPVDAAQLAQRKREIDRMSLAILRGELQALKLTGATTMPELRAGHARWLTYSLQWLAEDSAVEATSLEQAWAGWNEHKTAWLDAPDLRAQVTLVDTMLRALPAILQGRTAATSVMFPDSSMHLVEGIYRGNAVADYFNDILCDSVLAFVRARLQQDPDARIRILEIGAGTGGTSARVLARLAPYAAHIEQYCYTDLSRAFLLHAERNYGPHYPYLDYRLFDVGSPLEGQGIEAASYDVAIATNVMHATKDIRESLRNAKAVLSTNGVLLLNELSSCELWAHLTFGLLNGWWLYEDEALRIPGCPSLAPASWETVLRAEGYREVFFPAASAHALGQQVIVAESDGVALQRRVASVATSKAVAVSSVTPVVSVSRSREPVADFTPVAAVAPASLREKCLLQIKKLVGQILKMPLDKIDTGTSLDQYGIDSILVMELSNGLRAAFNDIGIESAVSPTLFFEYQTIDALADHFIATEALAMMRWVGLDATTAPQALEQLIRVVREATRSPARGFRRIGSRTSLASPAPSVVMQDVAIVGLSGRYPEAADVAQFWEHLKSGRNCIREVPAERWDHSRYFDERRNQPGKAYTKWAGFIDGVDCFDPLFFNISPREAESMSPQERLFLQEAYASIEDAGYSPASLCASRKIGMFVGVMNERYASGARFWSIANRISYLFDFQGPSMAVDTACSSSLTAIHLAIESLRNGSSEVAIAGGVNLIVDPDHLLTLSAMTMLSAGDKCKSFAADGDGFVDGEAVGAVVLKPLQRAVTDGDHIYGVIKGSAVNSGGKTSGYMVPNPAAHAQVVREALESAGVDARNVSYIEAQGTGSSLGDPIEIAGLSKAFQNWTADRQFCAIGSVKSNVGHCESAAGIVAISKVLMQMKHQTLVPSLHAAEINPNIDFARSPFALQRELAPWPRPVREIGGRMQEVPRVAGVSSFGAGGANAHVVVEEYVAPLAQDRADQGPAMVVLSARNPERLEEQVRRLLAAIAPETDNSDLTLGNLAYTLQVGREAMEERLALVVGSLDELRHKLAAYAAGETEIDDLYRGQARRNRDVMVMLAGDEDVDMAAIATTWIAKGKFDKLLGLWVKGLAFDWDTLHQADRRRGVARPQRISLPTYPFAKERYWIENRREAESLHPLLQRNTSDLSGLRFSTVFHLGDASLAHDVESGHWVLAQAAQLEMAHCAVREVNGIVADIHAQSVEWGHQPEVGAGGLEVHIALELQQTGAVRYEIYSELEEGTVTVHSCGMLVAADSSHATMQAAAAPLAGAFHIDGDVIAIDERTLQQKIKRMLFVMVSATLKVKQQDIDGETPLSEYGFDSISLTGFGNALNDQYQADLTPTIFFEFPTLDDLAGFLACERTEIMQRHFALQNDTADAKPAIPDKVQGLQHERHSRYAATARGQANRDGKTGEEPIAIIGMSGQFPQARDIDAFWHNLHEGKDCISEIPRERQDWRAWHGDRAHEEDQAKITWGGFIDGVDEFDPMFFGISPKEAELMDPQQRLMMLHVWKALEDAGYAGSELSGSDTAIYVGTIASGYSALISRARMAIEGYSSTGAVASVGPNRMSYFLNFHGPSEPVETACSSSLVALRRAILAIERGDCAMAIAGGVNTIVNPELHISFSKAGMLSEDGRCKTFSSEANGYVRGEGVAMLVLKKLSDAERDGDHIYGLVRGIAENHGGRANSLTAPNPKAQAAVIRQAHQHAGIDPRSVTYIEAHGTGTPLGDPVEINGLKAAFKELYATTGDSDVVDQHCGLGSVKTNIGHLELAAGVAGVIKVLLQMKHKTLVKSLHSDSLNPYIDLNGSPFYVVQEAREWAAIRDARGQLLPRRAGVSSFGFGGVNAHVVLEEYIPATVKAPAAHGPAVVVLSARNEERLREQVQQLLAFIGMPEAESEISLADLAYTLQVGREAMEERLGLVASSFADLRGKLAYFLAGNGGMEDLYRGQVRRNKDAMAAFSADEDMAHTVRSWVEKGKFGKLLDLWVKGYGLDWSGLYSDRKPRRISLPTYSFARERYWVQAGNTGTVVAPAVGAMLHPLMQRNSSNLSGLRFSSRFDGNEFFLADHVVRDKPVLPGVVQLEMARFAASEAMDGAGKLHLKDIVWVHPAIVGSEGLELHVSLHPQESGDINYEVHADVADGGTVYSRGVVTDVIEDAAPEIHDLPALRQRCTQAYLNAAQCYALFNQLGLHYGDSFQGLSELFVGTQLALARITLPAAVQASMDHYVLHPSLLDAAMQASIALQMSASAEDLTLMLPFALGSLDVLAPCTTSMWAVVRHSIDRASSDAVHTVDIDVCDDNGMPCLRFRQLGLRMFTTPPTDGRVREVSLDDLISHVEGDQATGLIPQPALLKLGKVAAVASTHDTSDDIQERAARYFVRFLSTTLKLPTHKIDPLAQMETYGIDSLLVLDLTRALEKQFGSLPKTLFFEYQTIAALSGYFVQHHRSAMTTLLGENRASAAAVSVPLATKIHKPSISMSSRSRYQTRTRIGKDAGDDVVEIAIIGVSGRYPQAGNLEQFWANLSGGK
ncbi:beta-ketoacyl synthase N-terminal-like domain-containing protein, partial [Rhodanobacter sp. A1T4]|uniref:beta-ketoacyl synthase N-terminal-like domain-containing protein n=1 Tax=Rhodanobacter sp. A1T4 TaxID=2723087 RepID=UPI00161E8CEF